MGKIQFKYWQTRHDYYQCRKKAHCRGVSRLHPCSWAFITAAQQQPQPEATDAVIAGISQSATAPTRGHWRRHCWHLTVSNSPNQRPLTPSLLASHSQQQPQPEATDAVIAGISQSATAPTRGHWRRHCWHLTVSNSPNQRPLTPSLLASHSQQQPQPEATDAVIAGISQSATAPTRGHWRRHCWHLTVSSQNIGAKVKCLLCWESRARTAFSYRNLHHTANSITKIPQVECRCPNGRYHCTCIQV